MKLLIELKNKINMKKKYILKMGLFTFNKLISEINMDLFNSFLLDYPVIIQISSEFKFKYKLEEIE